MVHSPKQQKKKKKSCIIAFAEPSDLLASLVSYTIERKTNKKSALEFEVSVDFRHFLVIMLAFCTNSNVSIKTFARTPKAFRPQTTVYAYSRVIKFQN